mgnify:CR=1 FL=1
MKKRSLFTAVTMLLVMFVSAPLAAQDGTTTDILRNESWIKTGPAVGPLLLWHNFRQHQTSADISAGVTGTWDLMLAQPIRSWYIIFRPGVSVLWPTMTIDAVLRLRPPIPFSLNAGGSFDPTWERDLPDVGDHQEYKYVREMNSLGKRSFFYLGVQYVTSFAFYELQYRVQLDRGARAYYYNPDGTPPEATGVRRYFLWSFAMSIRL